MAGIRSFAFLLGLALVPGIAAAQGVPPVVASTFDVSGVTQLRMQGVWPNSCIPTESSVTRNGTTVDVLVLPPPGIFVCFSAFREWEQQVSLGVLPRVPTTVNIYIACCSATPQLATSFVFVPTGNVTGAASVPATKPVGLVVLALLLLGTVARRRRRVLRAT